MPQCVVEKATQSLTPLKDTWANTIQADEYHASQGDKSHGGKNRLK